MGDNVYTYPDYNIQGTGDYSELNGSDGYELDDYYDRLYYANYNIKDHYYYYRFFDFERPMYLYAWEFLVILTTIANILVMLVLSRRSMRNATHAILIAIAVSDSLTGLVTLPAYIYAFTHAEVRDLKLTEGWCEAFMISRLFISKSFHTMSIWFTVCLVFQRFISVTRPFKAQTLFTMPKTLMMIAVVAVLSPVMHVYHLTNKKASDFKCAWTLKYPCTTDCAYLWISIFLVHLIPCVLLVIFTALMIVLMCRAEDKMQESNLITNQKILKRRAAQNRRISIIVIIVVVIFLVPEVPYAVFFLISVSLKHAGENLLPLEQNRAFHLAYEVLLVLNFHANFWVYTIMNRKFRSGLIRTFDPCLALLYRSLRICGIHKQIVRSPSISSSCEGYRETDTASRTLSLSVRSNQSTTLEMKTYRTNSARQQAVNGLLEEEVEKKHSDKWPLYFLLISKRLLLFEYV